MYEWTFFPKRQTRSDGECETDGFGEKRAAAEVTVDHEAGEDGLDLRNTRARRLKVYTAISGYT
jgi:hypothetical protein